MATVYYCLKAVLDPSLYLDYLLLHCKTALHSHRFGVAPFLPMSRAEMDALGWDACDIILVTGDAYVDHPSFGMAIIGRLLESQGFRVGIIAQLPARKA